MKNNLSRSIGLLKGESQHTKSRGNLNFDLRHETCCRNSKIRTNFRALPCSQHSEIRTERNVSSHQLSAGDNPITRHEMKTWMTGWIFMTEDPQDMIDYEIKVDPTFIHYALLNGKYVTASMSSQMLQISNENGAKSKNCARNNREIYLPCKY